jgi:NADPH:quinone reductase-like Zn-dependent oxidoreductase
MLLVLLNLLLLSSLHPRMSKVRISGGGKRWQPYSFYIAFITISVCRPVLGNYVFTQEEYERYSDELFGLIAKGIVKIKIHEEYEFSVEGIRKAQEDITGRKTTGKLVVKVA